MSPLPSRSEAETFGLVDILPEGTCGSCGKRPAATGRLMCHECRASVGLYEQPRIFGNGDYLVSVSKATVMARAKELGLTFADIGETIGRSKSWLCERLMVGTMMERDARLVASVLGMRMEEIR